MSSDPATASPADTPATPAGTPAQTLAAVDLGSNSFHMIVAQVDDGHLQVIDRLREMVQLAAGLDDQKYLSAEARERALDCLHRFGQRLRDMPPGNVRAVGTNTLRSARNAEAFRREAENALGHHIEVIAGREEARLIYLGVAHALAGDQRRRLLIDIGGGSTEAIIGEGFETLHRDSLYLGCVSMSRAWFPEGKIHAAAMRQAELAARMEFEPIERRFRSAGWEAAVGSSGTIKAIGTVLEAQGWSSEGITREGLWELRKALLAAGSAQALDLKGLKDERKPILAGGLAVLSAAFDALSIERMAVSDMALREGLLYDLLGRMRHQDVRDRTVDRVASRYDLDDLQARAVAETARAALAQVADTWGLGESAHASLLGWASRLHEIGLAVSRSGYHKHGGYILENADLAGFSRQEQAVLAALVRGHRRRFPEGVFEALPEPDDQVARCLCVLLRLAVVLHRGRSETQVPSFTLKAAKGGLKLRFPPEWLDAHPLTRADLEQEAAYLKAADIKLKFA